MDNISQKTYEIVKQIPKGKVATYGQIAKLLGNKYLCRAVGNALHSNPNFNEIPCYRIVNSKGELSAMYAFGGIEKQKELLISDGIIIINNRVNLKEYQWQPE